jgi:5-formyltetrahydrofolate cyclo-ligase
LPLLQNCASVAVYLATRNEANIDALARALMKRECVVAAPVLSDEPVFARLRDLENIVATGSGLRVPVVNTSADYVAVRELDVVLLPALAFNRSGARLGQGGGWYDRVLAEAPHVVAVGVCFDYQVLDALPIESHDMRVSIIVTETQIIKTD